MKIREEEYFQEGFFSNVIYSDGLAQAETLAQATAALENSDVVSQSTAQIYHRGQSWSNQGQIKCAFGANQEISSARN